MPILSQPKPHSYKYQELLTYIENGTLKLPKFQRDFVWGLDKSSKLIDSILKGYPVGTFIIWKTRERLRSIKNLGGANLPDRPEGDFIQYILDGQQRMATIFVTVRGLTVTKENKDVDYKSIFVDLEKDPDDEEELVTIEKPDGKYISIYDLLHKDTRFLVDNYSEYIDKIDLYKDKFKTYDFSIIEIPEYPIEKAVDIFTRINTSGQELTLFEIMIAKTYEEGKFDLAEKYSELSEILSQSEYEMPDATVLQCVALNLVNDCKRKTILSLNKQQIIDVWDKVIKSIKETIDFFKIEYQIPVSQILPYSALIAPFSYFFYQNNGRPSREQAKLLQEYFWKSSLSYRFSSGVEGKLAQDTKRIMSIMNNDQPGYDKKYQMSLTKESIKDYWFSTGDSFCKAILCMLTSLAPKSFNNNRPVKLDNSWLIKSNSKNYHHFFPRAYLRNKGFPDTKANVIANITIVDDFLNKREIGAKAPSDYMKKFQNDNLELSNTMKTHLIDNLDEFGIWNNDYEKFLDRRSELILYELNKRIEP